MFLAAQPCGQDGVDRHGQIRERLGVLLRTQKLCDQNAGIAGDAVPQDFKAADGSPCPERRILMNGGQNRLSAPCPLYRFYQYIPLLYAVTWVAFSFTKLIVSISSLPVLPSNRRVNRMGWSKGGFINTALLST